MIVSIPSRSNLVGLAALLVNLQPQLNYDDIIYIADNSDDNSVTRTAKMFATSRCLVYVEQKSYPLYESWNHGLELCLKENQEGVLTINDDILMSMTFINNLKRADKMSNFDALVPHTPPRNYYSRVMDPNFVYYSKMTQKKDIVPTNWMPGFVFYLPRRTIEKYGFFDTHFKIWYGDTEYQDRLKSIGKITNEYVWHAGSLSYKYQSDKVKKIIDEDKKWYLNAKKHSKQSSDKKSTS